MLIDIIIEKETVLTINTKSVAYLLKTTESTEFPIKTDNKEIIIKFRKELGE